jgi:hypothetical protein
VKNEWKLSFNILIKKEESIWVAHCLELDLVTESLSLEELERDIVAIIKKQVSYCIANNNMENLFRSAPKEVWDEFKACKEKKKPRNQEFIARKRPIPVSFVTNNCFSSQTACYA